MRVDLRRGSRLGRLVAPSAAGLIVLAGCGGSSGTKTSTTLRQLTLPPTTAAPLVPPTVSPSAATTAPTVVASTAGAISATSAKGSGPVASSTSVAGRNVTSPNASVGLGDSGSGVKQIQTALTAHGYKVAADGTFGAQTEAAVKAFQTANGIKADGVVGPATWSRLSSSTSASTTTTTVKTKPTSASTTSTTVRRSTTTTSAPKG